MYTTLKVVLLSLCFVLGSCDFSDLPGPYCRTRRPVDCCLGRDDSCAVPILGTLCYCDHFCNRTYGQDCCPDFLPHCLGITPPQPLVHRVCHHEGKSYQVGETITKNCNTCTCRPTSATTFEFTSCEDKVCLVRHQLIDSINRGNYGWRASNYTFLWGKSLDEGIRQRLGTFQPTEQTSRMTPIHQNRDPLPPNFDSRRKWPNLIQPVRDQGNCGSSWAFSTTAIASDRLGIQSQGKERIRFSPQHLLSCQNRDQRGCHGGHLDRAWWFLRKRGIASEECYPYQSGDTGNKGTCLVKASRNSNEPRITCTSDGREDVLHYTTPSYRVSQKEEEIMHEIFTNGPVQATFEVKEDFFLYKNGIYHHTQAASHLPGRYRRSGWHSVRIIGWGVDHPNGRPVKYWLCANSWGSRWGEDGYFRIVRGKNECEIENFILATWGKRRVSNGRYHGRAGRRRRS